MSIDLDAQDQITVLIVDDHPMLRSGLRQSLRELEYINVVGEAGDGRTAIKEALRLFPKIILMDVGLPGMDGLDASWAIKKELPRTRIIMFASRDAADDVTSALGVGADGYCLKHASTKRIASAIESVLRGEIWLDPELAELAVQNTDRLKAKGLGAQNLTITENRLLELIAQDMEVAEIAERLDMSVQALSALLRQIIVRHSETAGGAIAGLPLISTPIATDVDFSDKQLECTPPAPTKYSEQAKACFSSGWFSATVDTSDGLILADKYLLEGLLGSGGLGVVFKAKHLYMDRKVAIKFLKPEFRDEARVARAFQQEAKALANLKHPNIVDVYDFGVSTSNQPFLVMEFLDGVDLDFLFNRCIDRRLALDLFLPVFLQVSAALVTAHARDVIHCDLKPSNILLVPEEQGKSHLVKIVDFGLAKMVPRNANRQYQATDSFMVDGTPSYMPPEQCAGKTIDHRADIYSLGCVMYEAIAGLNPFKAETAIETFAKQIEFVPPPLAGFVPDFELDEALEGCVMKMLSKDPSKRHQSMNEILIVLLDVDRRLKDKQAS